MPTLDLPAPSVSTDWLARHLDAPDLRVLDASWYLPGTGRDARAEHLDAHVPGALFFDVDAASDPDTDLPHMLPTPERFAGYVESLGIGSSMALVVYDASGVNLSACRAWWQFRYFGHDRVAVLDGGLVKWRAEGRPLDSGPVAAEPAGDPFTPRPRPGMVRTARDVLEAVRSGREQVVDVRSPGRFAGTEPEPRPGLRGGHVPGSRNLPYPDLVDPADGALRPDDALRSLLRGAGVELERPVVALCGSGTSACALAWAFARLGLDDVAIYDGSWAEWGQPDGWPVETGPPR